MRLKKPRPKRLAIAADRMYYYATTATQSKTTTATVVCQVVVPGTLTLFRQQLHALKLAKSKHPDACICGVVERSRVSLTTQAAVSKTRPTYLWEDPSLEAIQ